jgi:hypothetical protein
MSIILIIKIMVQTDAEDSDLSKSTRISQRIILEFHFKRKNLKESLRHLQ